MDAGGASPVPTGKRVTLEDVAAAAGVSRALVSIVIREAPGASAATRERVLRAAADLGYRPDVRARLLARNQSKLIGTVFGMAGTFHFDVLDGLYTAAEDRGYELILSALTHSRGEARAVQSLQDFRFDALIMIGPGHREAGAGREGPAGARRMARRRPGSRLGADLRCAGHGAGRDHLSSVVIVGSFTSTAATARSPSPVAMSSCVPWKHTDSKPRPGFSREARHDSRGTPRHAR